MRSLIVAAVLLLCSGCYIETEKPLFTRKSEEILPRSVLLYQSDDEHFILDYIGGMYLSRRGTAASEIGLYSVEGVDGPYYLAQFHHPDGIWNHSVVGTWRYIPFSYERGGSAVIAGNTPQNELFGETLERAGLRKSIAAYEAGSRSVALRGFAALARNWDRMPQMEWAVYDLTDAGEREAAIALLGEEALR